MELSLLLMRKIMSMLVMVGVGFVISKKGIVKESDTQALSAINLYVICPCVVFSAYMTEFSAEKLISLAYCFVFAMLIHLIYIGLTWTMPGLRSMDVVPLNSLIYTNAGNLIISIIGSVLGEWALFYASAYITAQNIFIWTHLAYTMGGREHVSLKKILLNPNILAMEAGLVLFVTRLRFPGIIMDAVSSIAGMTGPTAMLIAGIIMANVDLREVFTDISAYITCFLRLFIFPLIIIVLLWITHITRLLPGTSELFMVPFLAAAAPAAATVTQMAKLYNRDFHTASVINIMSTVFCVISMPIMIFIYQLFLV